VNLPIGLVIWTALLFTFPSQRRPVARPRIDYLGATGISGGAALRCWAHHWPASTAGATSGVAVYRRRRRPLLPRRYGTSRALLKLGSTGAVQVVYLLPLNGRDLHLWRGDVRRDHIRAAVPASGRRSQQHESGLLMLPMMAGLIGGAMAGFLQLHRPLPIQGLVGITAVTVGMYLLSRLNVTATQSEVGRDIAVVGSDWASRTRS